MISQTQLRKRLRVLDVDSSIFTSFSRSLLQADIAQLENRQIQIKDVDFENASQVWQLIKWFNQIQSTNWMNHGALTGFCKDIFSERQVVTPIALLCPSYKKDTYPGIGDTIGSTSKTALLNFAQLVDVLKIMLPSHTITPLLFYADLSLERYEEQNSSLWQNQIEPNIELLRNFASEQSLNLVIRRLSEVSELERKIGYGGNINNLLIESNKDKSKAIIVRNRLFYVDQLGWDQETSDLRTQNSISSYAVMGEYFLNKMSNPIMLYTANSYEKASAYNFLNKDKSLLVLYPEKQNGTILPIPKPLFEKELYK